MHKPVITIAIDGPSASGKSTTARAVAGRLKYLYIDSGAMYRAVTLHSLNGNVDLEDPRAIAEVAASLDFEFRPHPKKTILIVNRKDISEAIRSPRVSANIKPIASNPGVREILVKRQQELGQSGAVVMDGRDIGTVVFPNAELKVYMTATAEARAERRVLELIRRGFEADFETVLHGILKRDQDDLTRDVGPLRQAEDAVLIDTTPLTFQEQVDKVCQLAEERSRLERE